MTATLNLIGLGRTVLGGTQQTSSPVHIRPLHSGRKNYFFADTISYDDLYALVRSSVNS